MKKILLVDYGSHYFNDVIACLEDLKVEFIRRRHDDLVNIDAKNLAGIILTGSPGRVNNPGDPQLDLKLLDMNIPILGICYGLQLLMHGLGGRVEALPERDLGLSTMTIKVRSPLNEGIDNQTQVWMAHYDHVTRLAKGFEVYATTPISIAMVGDELRKIYGIQYHPEAKKTKDDLMLFHNFIFNISGYGK